MLGSSTGLKRKRKTSAVVKFERQVGVCESMQGMKMVYNEPYIFDFLCIDGEFINPRFISVLGGSPEKITNIAEGDFGINKICCRYEFTIGVPVCHKLGLAWSNANEPNQERQKNNNQQCD